MESQKFIEEQPQILRLTTPRLKSTPGAPFAQRLSVFVKVRRMCWQWKCEFSEAWAIFPPDVAEVLGAGCGPLPFSHRLDESQQAIP